MHSMGALAGGEGDLYLRIAKKREIGVCSSMQAHSIHLE